MEALQKLFKSKFKQQALDGDSKYAKMNLEDSNPNNLPPPLKICALTIAQVKDFRVSKSFLKQYISGQLLSSLFMFWSSVSL